MTTPDRIAVWGLPVRLFHWALVACVLGNYFILEEGRRPHRWVGYAATALVVFRAIYGFLSPRVYERFQSFWPTPKSVLAYVKLLRTGSEPRTLTHNPLAALMMIALCGLVLLLGLSGWMMSWDRFWGEEWLEDLHGLLANSLIALSVLHAIAALVESYRHKENLVASMIHGRKRP
jgi:cytochrome b